MSPQRGHVERAPGYRRAGAGSPSAAVTAGDHLCRGSSRAHTNVVDSRYSRLSLRQGTASCGGAEGGGGGTNSIAFPGGRRVHGLAASVHSIFYAISAKGNQGKKKKKTNPKTPISFHIIKTTRVHTSVTPRTQPRADRKPRTRIHKPAKQPKDTNSVTRKQGIADPDRAVTLSLSQPDKN